MLAKDSFAVRIKKKTPRKITLKHPNCLVFAMYLRVVQPLSWDNLSVRRAKQKANLMYKSVNKLAPVYLCKVFTPRNSSFDLRDARQKLYSETKN